MPSAIQSSRAGGEGPGGEDLAVVGGMSSCCSYGFNSGSSNVVELGVDRKAGGG